MLTNPLYDPFRILTKVYSDGAFLQQAIADTYIEELNRSRTVKIVYGVLENDGYFEHCIRFYAPKSPKLAVRTILKISLYMLLFLEKKRYVVTDLAVELCKKLGKGGVAGFVNAFLRKFDRSAADAAIPQGDAGDCIRFSYPEYAYRMLKAEYGDRARSIASAKSAGVCVRFSDSKFAREGGIPTPFENAFVYSNFVRDDGFSRGEYTFQSVGSIAICHAAEDHEKLLDACAAPGGKSVLLSERCGFVTAFELHAHRVKLIEEYASRMGRGNIAVFQKDSSVHDSAYDEAFDGVLCDVPCSGFGTLSENPDIRLSRKEEDFVSLKKTQEAILSACSNYVKKGGALYYSTCSVFRAENDEIAELFLASHTEYSAERIESPLKNLRKKYGLQFLPDDGFGAGFYVAKLRRKK